MMFMKVDFPLPEAPMTARNVPASTSRVTPRSAGTVRSPSGYACGRSTTRMRASATCALPPLGTLRVEGIRGRRGARAASRGTSPRRVRDAGDHGLALGEAVPDLDELAVGDALADAHRLRRPLLVEDEHERPARSATAAHALATSRRAGWLRRRRRSRGRRGWAASPPARSIAAARPLAAAATTTAGPIATARARGVLEPLRSESQGGRGHAEDVVPAVHDHGDRRRHP